MNKQELNILADIQRIIEERNALRADKEALIDALRHSVNNCVHCKHEYRQPCTMLEGYVDCVSCPSSNPCPCKDCRDGSRFEWIGRSPRGKHAAPEHPLPVGVQRAMEEEKARKRGENNGEQ